MADAGTVVLDVVEVAAEVARVLGPVIQRWIDEGNVSAVEALRGVIPEPEVIAALDRALVVAQRRKQEALFDPAAMTNGKP